MSTGLVLRRARAVLRYDDSPARDLSRLELSVDMLGHPDDVAEGIAGSVRRDATWTHKACGNDGVEPAAGQSACLDGHLTVSNGSLTTCWLALFQKPWMTKPYSGSSLVNGSNIASPDGSFQSA
jgi:hypothetical protein